jgi:SNF2 family DNA or RNA helicase
MRILIANVATVKVGLNLSAASTIIFAENSFSGEARIQAEERATVRGKQSVEIIDFVSYNDTDELIGHIDDYILQAVRAKKDFNLKSLRR